MQHARLETHKVLSYICIKLITFSGTNPTLTNNMRILCVCVCVCERVIRFGNGACPLSTRIATTLSVSSVIYYGEGACRPHPRSRQSLILIFKCACVHMHASWLYIELLIILIHIVHHYVCTLNKFRLPVIRGEPSLHLGLTSGYAILVLS